jgi:serine/threonine protein phosphatase PrpC
VCQVTLPARGGRLLIGSDGLWDAVHPKTAAHHTREMAAAEAAHKLLALAIKADRLKDDVTGGFA